MSERPRPYPCLACGRSTVSGLGYCAFCLNGYVPPRLLGIKRWKGGVLVPVDEGDEQ